MEPKLPLKRIGKDIALDVMPAERRIFIVRSHIGAVLGNTIRLYDIEETDGAQLEEGDLSALERYVDIYTNEHGERNIYTRADLISGFTDQPILKGVLSVREVTITSYIPKNQHGY